MLTPFLRRLAVVALAAAALVGCDGGSAKKAGGPTTIGVALATRGDEFAKSLEQGFAEAAERHGYKLVVESADGDAAEQAKQLAGFVAKKVDAIVLVPCDAERAAAGLRGAAAAKIPVFTAVVAAKGADVVAHVASDEVQAGKLAAQALASRIGRGQLKAKVAVVGDAASPWTADRERGFEEGVKSRAVLEIVGRTSGDPDPLHAQSAADEALSRWPEIVGIFAADEATALGAVRAVESAGRKDVVVVGCGSNVETDDALRAGGPLKACVASDPKKIGERTIDAVATRLNGDKVDKTMLVNVTVVDASRLPKK